MLIWEIAELFYKSIGFCQEIYFSHVSKADIIKLWTLKIQKHSKGIFGTYFRSWILQTNENFEESVSKYKKFNLKYP